MTSVLLVYCSGGVRKGPQDADKPVWSEDERQAVTEGAGRLVRFIDPEARLPHGAVDSRALLGRDLFGVRAADAVIVDARQRRGVGIGVELLASRMFDTALIAVVPVGSHYRRRDVRMRGVVIDEYLHPHLAGLCDVVVEDFRQAGQVAADLADNPHLRGSQKIADALATYERELLAHDPDARWMTDDAP